MVRKRETDREGPSSNQPPRTWILQRNYGFVHIATLDEPIFIREKTVHYGGTGRGEAREVRLGYMTRN